MIDLLTFGPQDVVVTGPQTPSVTSVTLLGGSTYRINFGSPLSSGGTYQIRIGSNIAAPSGFLMDQDRDGTGGEATADAFVATVQIDTTGPRVTGQEPAGTVDRPLDSITITFNEPIAVDTFKSTDLVISPVNTPTGPISGFLLRVYVARYGLGDLETALSVLAGNWNSIATTNVESIHLGYAAKFPNPLAFPGPVVNNTVAVVTGRVTIPTAGEWTFGVSSDDGFRLRVNGQEKSFRTGRGAGEPDLLVVNFAAAGEYDIELIQFDGGLPQALEFSAAPGAQTAFNNTFRLVGDTANGGLAVTSQRAPVSAIPVLSVTPVNPQLSPVLPPSTGVFDGNGFAAKTVYATVGLSDLATAQAVLGDPTRQLRTLFENTPVINYFGNSEGAFSTSNRAFPGQVIGQDANNFIVEATARVTIPAAGEWTFGVNSDDGFLLKVGANEASFPGLRGATTSLATWNFAAAGDYDLTLFYFENGGGAEVELFASQGKHETLNSSFRLVGDTALGGLAIRSDAVVQTELPVTRVAEVATQFVIRFQPVSVNGGYQIQAGPNIADAAGNLMDQNSNGQNGQITADVYAGQFTIDRKPFRVLSTDPASIAVGALSQLDVVFSAPVQTGSFGVGDVEIFGALVTAKVLSVDRINDTTYRVRMEPVTLEGDYTVRIGPAIADIGGNLLNQDLDITGGELEDRFIATIGVENVSPVVREHAPSGAQPAPVSFIDISFSEPVSLDSFTADDVRLNGSTAVIPVTGIALVSGSTYRISFAPQTLTGNYAFTVGPNISDRGGQRLDQDGDGISGEPVEDQYSGGFTIDNVGPRVTVQTPSGNLTGAFNSITIDFSEPILASSLAPTDVVFLAPGGEAVATTLTRVNATQYRISFARQVTVGDYKLAVGPQVTDLVGNVMDQDNDGTFGETSDAYSSTINVTLPNLVFDSTTAPANAQNGQSITITWVTRNAGGVPTSGNWLDRVILSVDDVYGNGDGVELGRVNVTEALGANEAVTRSITAEIPFGYSGQHHIFVRLDHNDDILEATNADNTADIPITIGAVRPPNDLVAGDVTAPATAQSGTSVNVSWRVTNQGTAVTPANWSDRIYLSVDDKVGNDTLLVTVANTATLATDAFYERMASVSLPENLAAGQYWIFVQADALGQVTESAAENNNTARSPAAVTVTLAPVADLVVAQVMAPSNGVISQSLSVSWVVRNSGGGLASASWVDRVYLSSTGNVGGGTLLGTFLRSEALAASGEYSRTETITLPIVADGNYSIAVVTDHANQVFEREGESNNTLASANPIVVTHPDLVIETATAPAVSQSDAEITVAWTGRNAGTGSLTDAWVDRVYLSTNDTFSNDDVAIGELPRNTSLSPTQTYNASLLVRLPKGIEGGYRILVVSDVGNQVQEGVGENNNTTATPDVAIALQPYADLEVTTVIAQPLLVGDPVDLTISWEVSNRGTGTGPVDAWVDRVYLSTDAQLSGNDRMLGEFAHSGLVPVGESYTVTRIISLPPALEGRFTLFVQTDATDVVFEHTNARGNVGQKSPVDVVRIPYADLTVETVTVEALDASVGFRNGAPIRVNWIVSNVSPNGIGATNDSSWSDAIYISASADGQKLRAIGSLTHFGALGLGQSYNASVELSLPLDTPAGTHYLYVGTSGPFEFVYTGNNSKRSDGVTVTYVAPPTGDLTVEGVTAVDQIFDGSQMEVSWTVRNVDALGDPVTGSWVDTIYLAPDGNFNQAVAIGSFRQAQILDAGKSYGRSEIVTVPQHIQGVYQVFVRTDTNGEVGEDNENNNLNFSAKPTTVQLLARPNLQVTQILGPEKVTSGGVIDVEFTVTNTGPAPTPTGGSRWRDYVYLSNNTQPGGILLGSLPNGSALEPGLAYTTRASFQIQREAAGEYFIVVVADAERRVDEFQGRNGQNQVIGEIDNSRASLLFVDVTPVPPPDLVVQEVNAPLDAFDGNAITVRYRVANLGAGVTRPAGWGDSIWLVPEANRRPGKEGDLYLGGLGHSGALQVGEFYEAAATVNIPLLARGGLYYIVVWADSGNGVFELAFDENLNPAIPNDLESSNLRATPITIIPTPPADLEVTIVTAPATAVGGELVTISYTVANKGSAKTDVDRWAELIYISTDGTVNKGTLVFGLPHFGTLEIGQSYTETVSFVLPPSAKGSHFVVQTNADPNRLLTAEDSLLDQIAGIVKRAEERLGKPLAEVRGVDLQKLSRSDLNKILTGDGQAGPRLVFERGLTTNNTRSAVSTITDIPADLVVTSIDVPATSFSGEPITVSWTVKNQGVNAVWSGTQRWTDHIFISPDPTFIFERSSHVGSQVHVQAGAMNPGDTYTATAKVTVTAGVEGKYYVHVITHTTVGRYGPAFGAPGSGSYPDWPEHFRDTVWEQPDRLNNLRSSTAIDVTYREADLRVSNFSVVPTTSNSGGFLTVTFTVRNAGTRATRTDVWSDRVYVSIDQSLDLYDALTGNFVHKGVLAPGEQYTVTGEVRLPDNFSGSFNLIAFADSPFGPNAYGGIPLPYPETSGPPRLDGRGSGMVLEYRDEFNNTATTPIVVTPVVPPDLRVTAVTSAERVFTGRQFQVTYTVPNAGAGAVPERQNKWLDSVYLSRDQYLDARGDHYLTQVEHLGALAPDGSYTVTLTLSVPRGIVGPYYVMALTDVPNGQQPRGVVFEGSAELNNSTATAVPMLIEIPPPSDLQVELVTVPSQALPGQQVSFSWRVTNKGVEPASGIWADAAFLSRDAIWDLGDRVIINQDFAPRTLAPSESYTFTTNVQLPVALPADYRVIVRTDIFDDIFEGVNNRNNTTASADTIAVTVPTLQPGVPLSELLSDGEDLLFRVQVPAGETMRVTLDSDNDSLANELYVLYEGLPSSRAFDAAFEGGLQGDQVALVGRTEGGFYYIRVRNFRDASLDSGDPARFTDAPIQLTARLVPFGISGISPDTGGDSRYVTTTIRGAKFDPSATVKLIRPQFAEFAPVSYQVIDATKIIATFDLRNAPHGLYDVQVTNPNGAAAIAPYRFLVEAAKPLDVTVGLGGPSDIPVSFSGTTPALYQAGLLSLTNIDTPYAHLSFGVPRLPENPILAGQPIGKDDNGNTMLSTGERLRFTTNLAGAPLLAGVVSPELDPVINHDGILIAEGFAFDLHNQGFSAVSFFAEVYPELNAIIRENPKFLKELAEFEAEDLAFDFYIFATVTPMTSGEYVAYQTSQAASLRAAILADDAAPQALHVAAADAQNFASLYLAALANAGQLRAEDLPPGIREAPQFTGLVAVMTAGLLGSESGAPVLSAGNFTAFFDSVRKWAGHQPNAYGSSAIPDAAQFDLNQSVETRFEAFIIHVGVSDLVEVAQDGPVIQDSSPGDLFGLTGERSRLVRLTGPSGFGPSNFVPIGFDLPFTVRFEQIADATDAVNEIRILQRLDTDIDPRTFRLGDIQLGSLTLALPDRASFTGEFDFSNTLGYVVQVTAGVDVEKRLATWLLRAIDPDTGLTLRGRNLQTNQPQGLLLPGGSGVVGYTVESMDAASTGAVITSTARVIYNADAPLDSNTHEAMVDAVAPVTVVNIAQTGNTYTLDWSATDATAGSGVKEYTVYVSLNGGPFFVSLTRTTNTSMVYESRDGLAATVLVLAQDAAGNVESAPAGVSVAPVIPSVNLGSLPKAPRTETDPLPTVAPSTASATNPLFLRALLQVPLTQTGGRPTSFLSVFEPFTASAFAAQIPQSGAGIGPLGIAFTPDGKNVLISGGAGRNVLWKLSLSGGSVATPLATLDVPIYDMAFDNKGRLWATTGGGPLVLLDPATGQIVRRFGDGLNLGLAVDPNSSRIFVSSKRGVEIFDTATSQFTPFSQTRVDGLAFAPNGTLWGVSWPNNGDVIRFNTRGRAEVVLQAGVAYETGADGLAFGVAGTPTENLLFITHDSGAVTLVDTLSLQVVEIADRGSRADFVHVNAEGRVFVTQSDQVTVFFPAVAPRVIASTPINASQIVPIITRGSVTFDLDMLDVAIEGGSVTNPTNFRLTNTSTGATVPITGAVYESASRTVQLLFTALAAGSYRFEVLAGIQSVAGIALEESYSASFEVLQDLTARLKPEFSTTRTNQIDGTLSFDLRVVNTLTLPVLAPIRVVFGGLETGGEPPTLLTFDGVTESGQPYMEFNSAGDAALAPGQSITRTVIVRNPLGLVFDPLIQIVASVPPNKLPGFTSTPPAAATSGQAYQYAPQATDPDGPSLTFVLIKGPASVVLNAGTGALSWTPGTEDSAAVNFELRAYHERGGYATQSWQVSVAGVNSAPVLFPLPNHETREGELLEIPVGATDADGDELIFAVNHLPAGAAFDAKANVIRWQPGAQSAGRYQDVEVLVTDGARTTVGRFEIVVANVNQRPTLDPVVDRVVREGDVLTLRLSARDADGDTLVFGSQNLPVGATLSPETGRFEWTPRFDQHGDYQIQFTVSDGAATATQTLRLQVLNVNGAVKIVPPGTISIFEGQTVLLRLTANDPDHPATETNLLPDGTLQQDVAGPVIRWSSTTLPVGATFDASTSLLRWVPGASQSGAYRITFTATDDGDATGQAKSDSTTVEIQVIDANLAPTVAPTANQTVDAGSTLEFKVTATDGDGTIPKLTAAGLPAFATFTDNGDGSGTIRATPGLVNRGSFAITIRATDNGNGNPARALIGEASFVLTVKLLNAQPVLSPVGDKVALIDQELVFQVRVSDLDENPLTYSAQVLPAGAAFTAMAVYGVAEFKWKPTATQAGAATLTLTVTDDGNGVATNRLTAAQTFKIVVRAANQSPVLAPISLRQGVEGQPLEFVLQGNDPDGDALTYFATNLPDGAALDARSGTVRWTPASNQGGSHAVVFGVTDGHRSSTQTAAFSVAETNRPPTLVPLPPLIALEGVTLSFNLAGSDLDGDRLAFFLETAAPAGASFDPATQVFEWTPGFEQAGRYALRFAVQDTAGARTFQEVVVDVSNVNRTPAIPALEGRVALVGQPFRYLVLASDPDSATSLRYSISDLPAGATFDTTTGELLWNPSSVAAGEYNLRFSASDGELAASRTLRLVVASQPIPPDVRIELTPSFPAVFGQSVLIQATASSLSEIRSLRLTIDGRAYALDSFGRLGFTPGSAGHFKIVATATDVDGVVGTATADLKVRDPQDAATPLVRFTASDSGVVIRELQIIAGVVSDSNLDQYRLELVPLDGRSPTLLAQGRNPINGALTQIDPGGFVNGAYLLRLTATDISGRTSTISKLIEINSTNKPAGYAHSVTDLTAIIGGVNIPFTRNYSSTDTAFAGAAGYGWHFAGMEAQITTSIAATADDPFNLATPYRDGARLYLTLPDGRRVGFTFSPTPAIQGAVALYRPSWTADTGVDYRLSSTDALLELAGGSYYHVGTGLPYNPTAGSSEATAFVLAVPDGSRFGYSASGTLNQTVSSQGQRLIWTSEGVAASNGERITFTRDNNGRVTGIQTTSGSGVRYEYDSNANMVSVTDSSTGRRTIYGYHAGTHLLTVVAPPAMAGTSIRYDESGRMLQTAPIPISTGGTSQFLSQTFNGTLTAGVKDLYSLVLTPSEFASATQGRLILGAQGTSAQGGNSLTLRLLGINGESRPVNATTSIGFATLSEAGAYVLEVSGASSGAYQLRLFVAGDVNADGRVDGVDAGAMESALGSKPGDANFSAAADVDGDRVVTAVDREYVLVNSGFVANRLPTAQNGTLNTHANIPVSVSLRSLSADANGDALSYRIGTVNNATARILEDGFTVRFEPTTNFSGAASFTFVADDGSGTSQPATVTVNVSNAPLLRLNIDQRSPHLTSGQSARVVVTGDFADEAGVELPGAYLTFISTNPAAVVISPTGWLTALADGTSAVVASRGTLRVATAVRVGEPATVPDRRLVSDGLQSQNLRLAVAPDGGTITIRIRHPDGTDVTSADSGILYFVGDDTLATVSSGGLITGKVEGETRLTAIYRGAELVIPVRVTKSLPAPSQIGPAGGIVQGADGSMVTIAPGALKQQTSINFTSLAQSGLPYALLTEQTFAAGFQLAMGADPLLQPAQLAVRTTGLAAGTEVVFYRATTLTGPNGTPVRVWLQTEFGVVGADGFARTGTQQLTPGVRDSGVYLVSAVQPGTTGLLRGRFTLRNPISAATSGFHLFVDPPASSQVAPQSLPGPSGLPGATLALALMVTERIVDAVTAEIFSIIEYAARMAAAKHIVVVTEEKDIKSELPDKYPYEVEVNRDAITELSFTMDNFEFAQGYPNEKPLIKAGKLEKPEPSDPPETLGFALGEIVRFESFTLKLKHAADPVSQFLRGELDSKVRGWVDDYTGGFDKFLQKKLTEEMNRIVTEVTIYDPVRFAGVTLSQRTRDLIAVNPEGAGLINLNRALLENAYPDEIPQKAVLVQDGIASVVALEITNLLWADAILGVGATLEDIIISYRPVGSAVGTLVSGRSAKSTNGTLRTALPENVAIGDVEITVQRVQKEWTHEPLNPNPVAKRVIKESNAVRFPIENRYIFAALTGNPAIAVIDSETNQIVARMPVSGGVPRATALASNLSKLYAALQGTNQIAVFDTVDLKPLDANLTTPEIDNFELPLGASVFWLATDPANQYLFVTDEFTNAVYVVDIVDGSATYGDTVQTYSPNPAPHGLIGIAVDADGSKVYVAAPNSRMFDGTHNHVAGKIIVANVDRQKPEELLTTLAVIDAANEPYGVTAGFKPGQFVFVNRQTDGSGFGAFNGVKSIFANLNLGKPTDAFDVNNGIGVAVLPDATYAFVSAFNRFIQDLPSHDPNIPPFTAGGNIGVIKDPFGTPVLVAATLMVPISFPDNIVLSPDGKTLYAAYRGGPDRGIYVYDVDAIIKTVQERSLDDLSRFPLDKLNPDVFIGRINTGTDRPQGLSSRVTVGPDLSVSIPAGQKFEPGEKAKFNYNVFLNQNATTNERWVEQVSLINDKGLRILVTEGTFDKAGPRSIDITFPKLEVFRSPGAISAEDLDANLRWEVKVDATNALTEPNKENNKTEQKAEVNRPDLSYVSMERPWLFFNAVTRRFDLISDKPELKYTVKSGGEANISADTSWVEEVWIGTDEDVEKNDIAAGIWHIKIATIQGEEASGPFESGQQRVRTVALDLSKVVVPQGINPEDLLWIILLDVPQPDTQPPALNRASGPTPHLTGKRPGIAGDDTSNNLGKNEAPTIDTHPLRFAAVNSWTYSDQNGKQTATVEDGVVNIGFEPEGNGTFVPLLSINGRTVLDTNRGTATMTGIVTALVGNLAGPLFTGTMTVEIRQQGEGAETLARVDTSKAFTSQMKIGGVQFDVTAIGFSLANAYDNSKATPYPGELQLYTNVTLPEAFGADASKTPIEVLKVPGSDFTSNSTQRSAPGALVLSGTKAFLNSGILKPGTKLNLDGFEMTAQEIILSIDGAGNLVPVELMGKFSLPQFGDAVMEVTKPNGAFSMQLTGSRVAITPPKFATIDSIKINDDWFIRDVKVTFFANRGGTWDIKGEGAVKDKEDAKTAYFEVAFEKKTAGGKTTFEWTVKEQPKTIKVLSLEFTESVKVYFKGDVDPAKDDVWDPQIEVAGTADMPEDLLGSKKDRDKDLKVEVPDKDNEHIIINKRTIQRGTSENP